VDQLEQDLSRFKLPAMAAVAGVAAALVVATLPAVYLEKVIGLTGIAEIISAAAPPLGNTAKSLIALAAGIFSASLVYVFLNRKGGSDMSLAIRKNLTPEPEPIEEEKPKFAMPKFSLKKMLQKPKKKVKSDQVTELADLPKLREADSHPDAPARRPIFAESDLGSPLQEKIKPFEEQVPDVLAERAAEFVQEVPEEQVVAEVKPAPFVAEKSLQMQEQELEAASLDIANAATPATQQNSAPFAAPGGPQPTLQPEVPSIQIPVESSPTAVEPAHGNAPFAPPAGEPQIEAPVSVQPETATPMAPVPTTEPSSVAEPASPVTIEPKEDLSGLSIAQLADRLESGLARLRILQSAPQTETPAVAVPTEPKVSQPTAGSISVTSSEEPMQVPPLKTVAPTEEDAQAARQADMDAALKAALGTLEKMTAHR